MAGTTLAVVEKTIAEVQPRFTAIAKAGGGYVDFATEARYARQIISRSSALMRCEIQSIEDSVMNIAAVGLSLNPALQHAALIPRRAGDKKTYCHFDPMYRGLIKLATDSGSVVALDAAAVYEEDVHSGNFTFRKGTEPFLNYTPDPLMKIANKGEIVGAFCVAEIKSATMRQITYMPIDEILEIRERSEAWKAGKSGPWKTDFQEMAVKTCIKRARKQWPMGSGRLDQAIHLANQAEGYIEPHPDDIVGTAETVDTRPKVTQDQANELRLLCRQAGLRVARVYEKYSIRVMEELPANQFDDCKTNCWIAIAHHECKAAEKGTTLFAEDYGLTYEELEGIAATYQSKATLRTKREPDEPEAAGESSEGVSQ